eukprot:XP_024442250.1 putative cyclic nucleotide-gated ion channel 19 isoform X3 [Populus trichocarpa]
MANHDKDDIPMLSYTHPKSVDENVDSRFRPFLSRTQSASTSIPLDSMESYGSETNLVGFTGPLRSARKAPLVQMSGPLYINRNTENLFLANHGVTARKKVEPKPEKYPSLNGMDKNDWDDKYTATNAHLMRSGQLGMCNDPYCTTCPSYYHSRASQQRHAKTSSIFDSKDEKCIVIDWGMTKAVVSFRCLTDAIYLLNIFLQFRLAYVAPESRVVGAGELVDHPKKIAMHYLRGCFFIDLFVVLPLPQIIVLALLPKGLDSSGANYAKNLLRAVILVQYIPRLFRFIPLLIGQSPNGFIFETASANFFINLFTFVLSGHIIGSCWYLFGLQRVNQCLRDACRDTNYLHECKKFIDCGGHENIGQQASISNWNSWKNNVNASACFTPDVFSYGIYAQAVNLTGKNTITRYTYSLFWGFQQISTLAGNQTPSYFVWEILFTMAIIGIGLLLFAFLIGNMQNFLQALGRRRSEMSLRRRDVDQWMRHRRLPVELRRRVIEAERYHWAATRGVNEEMLLENLPEDLQRDIRRHLFKFVKKVWIFHLMDEHVLDAVCEKLKQKIYIKGSAIFYVGGLVEKMVFIVRGKVESIGHDGTVVALSEGNVCGEELLTWFLEHSSVSKDGRKIKISGQRLISSRTVRCLTNVEAFSLSAADLEQVTSLFARNLRNPLVQGAIRYQSPYWRALAATRIQVAWRYRQKRLKHSKTTHSNHFAPHSNHSSFSRI